MQLRRKSGRKNCHDLVYPVIILLENNVETERSKEGQ